MDPYVLKPPTKTLSTSMLFFARQFFYPADPFRHNKYSMSNSNPLARLLLASSETLAEHLDAQQQAIECLYGQSLSKDELEYVANTIEEKHELIYEQFTVIGDLLNQYKNHIAIARRLAIKISDYDSLFEIPQVDSYKPDPDVLKNILDES